MKNSSSRIRGFSLIELLVVVFIIAIIATFVAVAAPTILRGSQMSQGSQILADQVSLARQYALSKNHPVEVRFIRFADPEMPGETIANPGTWQFRAIQVLETLDIIDPNSNPKDFVRVPLDKPALLPQSIIMNQYGLSTLLVKVNSSYKGAPPLTRATGNDPSLPRKVGTNYDYVWFRFLPDGSTNLPIPSPANPPNDGVNLIWYVTLQNITDPARATAPPANFFTLQIDPVSGTIKQFRPGI